MGDFQRTRSKVWWSNFADPEDESVSRVSSSSPSSSHKSQDSGFSDSEAAAPHSVAATLVTVQEHPCPCNPSEESLDNCRNSSISSVQNLLNKTKSPPRKNDLVKEPSILTCQNDFQSSSTRVASDEFVNVKENNVTCWSLGGHQPETAVVELSTKKCSNLQPAIDSSNSDVNQPLNCKDLAEQLSTSQNKNKDNSFTPELPVCLDVSGVLGPPTHTSTPKSTHGHGHGHGQYRSLKQSRPVNLFKDYSCEERTEYWNPVRLWLEEIGSSCDPECMTTLQSKSLAVDLNKQVMEMSAEAIGTVRGLQDKTRIISNEFSKLVQQIEYRQLEQIAPLVQSLVGNIVEFLYDFGDKQKTDHNKDVVQACDKLRRTAIQKPVNEEELTTAVTTLGRTFTHVVDTVLSRHVKSLIRVVEAPCSEMALRSALSSLITLGLDGGHMSQLVADSGGIQALLTVCLESKASSIRTAALRALATVCCLAETIRQLEQAGGLEILAEILSEQNRPEPEISEAAAVLAQITAPWVEDNHSIKGLAEHLQSIVQSLTNLIAKTESDETLLLAAAALANLTFLESRTVWPLLEFGSAGHLLTALRQRGPLAPVFLQEQAATLLANMAAVPESRPHLAEQRAVVALLCFLQIRHSPLECAKQIAAAERVQQKSAIALSRLCSDPGVASEVVQLQGVPRLVRLCKEERERNHSDGVLVACLAALRKIAANCGTKAFEDLDALELVEPRLLDSFLIYSSRQESYV